MLRRHKGRLKDIYSVEEDSVGGPAIKSLETACGVTSADPSTPEQHPPYLRQDSSQRVKMSLTIEAK